MNKKQIIKQLNNEIENLKGGLNNISVDFYDDKKHYLNQSNYICDEINEFADSNIDIYTYNLFENTKLLKGNENLNKPIKDNCILLILCSLALNKEYVSERYMIEMEKYLPFNISYIEKHSKTTMRKLKSIMIQL